ncbi:MAG: DUF2066 domain-containing protein [Gammaproteobacteria bacterium]
MKRMLPFLLVLFVFFPMQSYAMKVSNLYQAEFTVTSKTADERGEVAPVGLLSVLMKLTGDSRVTANLDIKDSLNRAEYFVSKYYYFLPSADSSQYRIQMNYEPADVNRLLKRAGIPFWGVERPLILVWLVVNDKQHTEEIIGSESADDVVSMIKRKASRFGLPIIFPMMDVEDMHQVPASDVVNMNVALLRQAGSRYAPNALLIGRLDWVNNEYQSIWELATDKQQWRWSSADKSVDALLDTVLGQVVQTFAKEETAVAGPVAVSKATPVRMKLEVYNINTPDEQAKLAEYLAHMTVVQAVNIDQVTGDTVDLSLALKGTVSQFHQAAADDKRIVFKSKDESGMYIYVWAD